jgi:hypothetical protein
MGDEDATRRAAEVPAPRKVRWECGHAMIATTRSIEASFASGRIGRRKDVRDDPERYEVQSALPTNASDAATMSVTDGAPRQTWSAPGTSR